MKYFHGFNNGKIEGTTVEINNFIAKLESDLKNNNRDKNDMLNFSGEDCKSENEYHLFILWENARKFEDKILEDIKKKFKILKQLEIEWDTKRFNDNLSSFYSEDFQYDYFQTHIRGTGKFLLVVVEDTHPVYGEVEIQGRKEYLNKNVFDAKHKYRSLTGAFTVHGTDNMRQTRHDLALLLGISLKDFLGNVILDGRRVELKRNVPCVEGWNSLEYVFYILNETCEYAVLRGFETLPHIVENGKKGDVDLLVDNEQTISAVLISCSTMKKNAFYFAVFVRIADDIVPFHAKCVLDDYYDYRWEQRILKSRELNGANVYIPSKEMYFWSLLYHGIIHKVNYLKYWDIFEELSADLHVEIKKDMGYLSKLLSKFMEENGYFYGKHLDMGPRGFHLENIPRKEQIRETPHLFYYSHPTLGAVVISQKLWETKVEMMTHNILYYTNKVDLQGHRLPEDSQLYKECAPLVAQGELMWIYKRRFGKLMKTVYVDDATRQYFKKVLLNVGSEFFDTQYLKIRSKEISEYIPGENFFDRLNTVLHDEGYDGFIRELDIYMCEVFHSFDAGNGKLSPNVYDMLPQNCILTEAGRYVFYDMEYELKEPMDKSWMLYRLVHGVPNDYTERTSPMYLYKFFSDKYYIPDQWNWADMKERYMFQGIFDDPKDTGDLSLYNRYFNSL